jgi:hypothetical protein
VDVVRADDYRRDRDVRPRLRACDQRQRLASRCDRKHDLDAVEPDVGGDAQRLGADDDRLNDADPQIAR